MLAHCLTDQWISREFVNKGMEIHVSLEACSTIAGHDHVASVFDQRTAAENSLLGYARCGQFYSKGFDCRPELVDCFKEFGVDRCDGETSPSRLRKKSLRL